MFCLSYVSIPYIFFSNRKTIDILTFLNYISPITTVITLYLYVQNKKNNISNRNQVPHITILITKKLYSDRNAPTFALYFILVIKKHDSPTPKASSLSCLYSYILIFLYSYISNTSTVRTASSIISSILSASFNSECLITLRFGFVTGCFATNVVQQSSYG